MLVSARIVSSISLSFYLLGDARFSIKVFLKKCPIFPRGIEE